MNAVLAEVRDQFPAGGAYRETPWNGGAFLYGLVCLYRPQRVIEVGCSVGATSAFICEALKELGGGSFVGFEKDVDRAGEAIKRLDSIWRGGDWVIATWDFFETIEKDPVDFAFLDLDPKEDYIRAYERIPFADKAVLVAHDLLFAPKPVIALYDRLRADGWKCKTFEPERGFIVAVKP